MKRTRVSLVAMALAAGFSLTACGGADDAPADASKADFCKAVMGEESAAFDPDNSAEEQAKALNDYAEELEKVGTPKGISDDARKGFEHMVDELKDLDAKDIEEAEKEGEAPGGDLSDEEEKHNQAFTEYVTETCADEFEANLSDLETPDTSDLEKELENELDGLIEEETESP